MVQTLLPFPITDDVTRYELEHFDDEDVKETEEEIEEEEGDQESDGVKSFEFIEDDFSNCIRDKHGHPVMRIVYQ